MPWVVGIDEAGYGPNLGPLVQSAVAVQLPEDELAGWKTLKPVIRRVGDKTDVWRLLVDDSKKVYSRGGLEALEMATLMAAPFLVERFGMFLPLITLPWVRTELAGEAWYDEADHIPMTTDAASILAARDTLGDAWKGVNAAFGPFLAAVTPTPRFNRICDETNSKATVLSRGFVELLGGILAELPSDEEPMVVTCDKQGGRNFYAGMVQEAFPNGWVIAERESGVESRYRVELLDRKVTITFRPRADGDSVAVALASMLCKYLREVCMKQFNRFWAKHVPGIEPTAGYPVDAKRFYEAIQPAMQKLELVEDQVWRKR
jgi:ribonuclease HII